MKPTWKLYVWTNFSRDWTGGLAVAVARSEKEARELVAEDYSCEPSSWGVLKVYPTNRKFGVALGGGG